MKRKGTRRSERRHIAPRKPLRKGEPFQSGRKGITDEPPDEEPWVEPHKAVWLNGRVPNGYWHQPAHRRLYMRWLGQRLGFHRRQDWYRITTADFNRNGGGGLLHHWHYSAIFAVQDTYRDYDWKPWLFKIAPRHFWQDQGNHRKFMQWLGEQLDIRDPSDWYHVTNQDFKDHAGSAFLIYYDSTVSAAIMSYLPDYDWKEWMFDKTPKGFWDHRKNRRRYMMWLGTKLGFQTLDDWYAVTDNDFRANCGRELLKRYGGSPLAALRDCFPRHTWYEWKFARVPAGFWDDLDNCKRYVRWLGKKLKMRRPQDWHKVRRRDWLENCGGGLLAEYHSPWNVLRKCVPGLKRKARKAGSEEPSKRGAAKRRRRVK